MATRMSARRIDSGNVVKGAIAGVAAGLAAAWVMTEFQALWSKAVDGQSPQSAGGRHDAREWQERNEDQNATELTAQAIAAHTIDRPLTDDELAIAAPAVHYGFGASMGALYGALAEAAPARTTVATGAAFGTLIWIGGDEIAVPLFGLSKANAEYSLETHAQAWAAHIVYGVTTELVRRGVRRLL
jgi:putative membrane protein